MMPSVSLIPPRMATPLHQPDGNIAETNGADGNILDLEKMVEGGTSNLKPSPFFNANLSDCPTRAVCTWSPAAGTRATGTAGKNYWMASFAETSWVSHPPLTHFAFEKGNYDWTDRLGTSCLSLFPKITFKCLGQVPPPAKKSGWQHALYYHPRNHQKKVKNQHLLRPRGPQGPGYGDPK